VLTAERYHKYVQSGGIRKTAKPGPELNRKQLSGNSFAGELNEVFSAQLSEDALIFAASIYYCEELLLS
jgi:hypothetical protein